MNTVSEKITQKPRILFFFIYLACLLGSTAYGFIYLLPIVVAHLGGNSIQVGIILGAAGLTTVICVSLTGYFTNHWGAENVCAIGGLICSLSFLLFCCSHQINYFIYIAGLLLGCGWSLFYAALPMLVVRTVNKEERIKYLSYLSALVVVGLSIGPIIGKALLLQNFSVNIIFYWPFIMSLLSSVIFFTLWCFHNSKDISHLHGPEKNKINNGILTINLLRSEAKYPLIIGFLGACIFSAMMNFQTFYANSRSLDFSVYYTYYMMSVVMCRFVFGGVLSKKSPLMLLPYLVFLIAIGLIIMLYNSGNELLYGISAIVIGVGYGLFYPLVETYAVNVTAAAYHNQILAYFNLFYFIGIYAFPIFCGFIINCYNFSYLLSFLIVITLVNMLFCFAVNIRMKYF